MLGKKFYTNNEKQVVRCDIRVQSTHVGIKHIAIRFFIRRQNGTSPHDEHPDNSYLHQHGRHSVVHNSDRVCTDLGSRQVCGDWSAQVTETVSIKKEAFQKDLVF